MKPPTPPEVRAIIVRLRQEGRSYDAIARLADVGLATVSRILTLHRVKGNVDPKRPGGGNFSPIRGRAAGGLKNLVEQMPDATIAELARALVRAEKLATSTSGVQRALTRLGYSRKKRHSSR
jgi:transposase